MIPLSRPQKKQRALNSSTSVAQTTAEAQTSEVGTSDRASRAASASTIPTSDTWELDFSSRPILDERGKKVWELLICSPGRSWEYSQYFPNNKINSTQLRTAIEAILAQQGAVKPEKCRFFRGQMQTIITRALKELDIRPLPSRRCFTLIGWLEERLETVYKAHQGYNDKAQTLFTLDLGAPGDLPDALRGEQWGFVQLPLGALLEEMDQVTQGEVFGATFPLDTAGLSDMDGDTLVPGVAVYSRRAGPMAAWTNGFELAALVADVDRSSLILETGVNQRWMYGRYRRSAETTGEAQAWEAAKKNTRGLHFLVIQGDEEADNCAGLWLLQDRELPSI
ncbi:hypothetical protein WJX72_008398 [[Myrmecia] bisecta]|uniref:Uncharacterized protein n=1 Tax=[Myrmecia] bisecta TaxID=41462 RepID=A0AAW1R7W8_9CHLO